MRHVERRFNRLPQSVIMRVSDYADDQKATIGLSHTDNSSRAAALKREDWHSNLTFDRVAFGEVTPR